MKNEMQHSTVPFSDENPDPKYDSTVKGI